ncbi:hypothetical protein [Propionicicella superfundia]|uniref:hypothetical protein n=1 Tax=Propionicicella superfundia TaxID=348582 RepID=UPI000418877D|nr:hypothetical protein [Propionicicella superfundia]
MPIPPLEPTNLMRQALLAWERALRRGQGARARRPKEQAPVDPASTRDTERPPQIW